MPTERDHWPALRHAPPRENEGSRFDPSACRRYEVVSPKPYTDSSPVSLGRQVTPSTMLTNRTGHDLANAQQKHEVRHRVPEREAATRRACSSRASHGARQRDRLSRRCQWRSCRCWGRRSGTGRGAWWPGSDLHAVDLAGHGPTRPSTPRSSTSLTPALSTEPDPVRFQLGLDEGDR